jgi:chromosome partitioning protein
MIVTIGGIKGGSGKTTIATNLAVISAIRGEDVLLIDADDQETSSDFTILRNEQHPNKPSYTSIKLNGAAVRTETARLADKYETIIIDTGGRDTSSQRAALSISDILLVPFVPRSFDIWTLEKVGGLVEEMRTINSNLAAYTFINRADPRGNDNEEASEVIKETPNLDYISCTIGMRKAFGNAAASGLSVIEVKPNDIKAKNEIITLYQHCFNVNVTLPMLEVVGG